MKSSVTDRDKGLRNIVNEMKALGKLSIKAGITEAAGSAKPDASNKTVAEYGTYNEFGVPGRIPARPFIRGWFDNNEGYIKHKQEVLVKGVSGGVFGAETAIGMLGQYAQSGIQNHIKTGDFQENSEVTKKIKGSSRPLIDTGTLRNSIRYEVVKK